MTTKQYQIIYSFITYLLNKVKENKMGFDYEQAMEIKDIYDKMNTLSLIAIMKNSEDQEIIMDICEKLRELLQIIDNQLYREG